MSIIQQFLKMFGIGGPDFAKFDPDNIDAFIHGKLEIENAEREDDEEGLQAALAKYGVKDTDHLDEVGTAMMTRHRANPHMLFAEALLSHNEGIQNCADSGHPIPAKFLQPVEGMELHQFALLSATVEAEGAAAAAQRYGIDEAAVGRIDAEWRSRMSSTEGTFTANILSSGYHTFHAMAKVWVSNGHALYRA